MDSIRDLFRKNKVLVLLIGLLAVMVSVPLYKQGIMCNDELVTRFLARIGFRESFAHYAREYTGAGRALAVILDPITIYLGFLGSSNWSFRVLQILTIFLNAGLFAVLLNKLFHSRAFAAVCGISIVVFLPVTFEHTAPNAFNALFNIPFSLLQISLILYTVYLEQGKKKHIVISMVLLFLNLTSYESFVMFLPLYGCIALGKIGWKNKKRLFRTVIWPVSTAVLFLALYALCRVLYPVKYSGIRIEGISVSRALEIIWQLFRSSFPGYYLFDAEYRNQAQLYNKLGIENYVRAGIVCVLFGIVIITLLGRERRRRTDGVTLAGALGAGVLCIVLPTVPNAIAEMYQKNIGIGWWVAVPTSYFCYFGATFICWFVVWQITSRGHGGILSLAAIGIAVYLLPVQCMNDIFAQRNREVFQRITTMEALFSTDLAQGLEGKVFCSTDFFKHINILGVHESYWNDFAEMMGLDIKIINGMEGEGRIYFDDQQIAIWYGDGLCVLTSEPREGYGVCQYTEEEYRLVKYHQAVEDNGFYVYFYQMSDTGELRPGGGEMFRY